MKLTDYELHQAQKVLIYGPPKSGKSLLAASLAEKYKLLWLDNEDGIKAVVSNCRQEANGCKKEWLDNIELIRLPDTKTYPIAGATTLKIFRGTPTLVCHKHGGVDCAVCVKQDVQKTEIFSRICLDELDNNTVVVIDSLTQLSDSILNQLTRKLDLTDLDTKIEWIHYEKQGHMLLTVLNFIQAANINFAVTSHEMSLEQENGKEKIIPVGGTKNFAKKVAKYFDHVVYCEMKNQSHKVGSSTTYAGNILTGSRTNVALESGKGLNLIDLFEGIKGINESEVVKKTEVKKPQVPGTNAQAKAAAMLAGLKKS